MRSVVVAVSLAFVVVTLAACKAPTPAALAEEKVRALYAGPLGDRDHEREALRTHGTERLKAAQLSLDASCNEILANDAPNHGLNGPALADFNKNCLDGKPLSCGGAALTAVDVGTITGTDASVVAHVGDKLVDVSLKIEGGKFFVDDVVCR